MEAYGGSTSSGRVFGWKKTKRKQRRPPVDKYGSMGSLYSSYRSPCYLYGSVSSRPYPWDTYPEVPEPIYEEVTGQSAEDSCTCDSPVYAELYGPRRKKKSTHHRRSKNSQLMGALETRDPFGSVASRKSILECEVTAYDLVSDYFQSKGTDGDSDLDDHLSDNAVEEGGRPPPASPPASEAESGIYSHLRVAGYGVRIVPSSDSASSTRCSLASDDDVYSWPEPDYDDSDQDVPTFKDLKIASSPRMLRRRPGDRASPTHPETGPPRASLRPEPPALPSLAVRIRNCPGWSSEVKSILKKTERVWEIEVDRSSGLSEVDRKKKHVRFESGWDEGAERTGPWPPTEGRESPIGRPQPGLTVQRIDQPGFTVQCIDRPGITVQCIDRPEREETRSAPNGLELDPAQRPTDDGNRPIHVACVQNGNRRDPSKNGNFSPTVVSDVWGTFSSPPDTSESADITVDGRRVEGRNRPPSPIPQRPNGTLGEVVVIPAHRCPPDDAGDRSFSRVIQIQNDAGRIKILTGGCPENVPPKTEIYVSHGQLLDVGGSDGEKRAGSVQTPPEEDTRPSGIDAHKIILNTADGQTTRPDAPNSDSPSSLDSDTPENQEDDSIRRGNDASSSPEHSCQPWLPSESESILDGVDIDSVKSPGLYNVENWQPKSFFEGASRTEILSYLEDAKSRGVDDLTEEDIRSLIDIDSSSISSVPKEAIPAEVVQNIINLPQDTTDDSEHLTVADIERNDSGVGTETSKPPRLRRLILPGTEELSCADCDLPIESSTDDQLNSHFYPLVCQKCEKKRSERKEIIAEIVDTEFKYGHDLKVIKEEFYCPMEVAGLLTKVQLRSIFLNLDELMRVNVKFAEKLKDALDIAVEQGDEDYTNVNIGRLFLESSSMLHAFETYCIRQGAASMLLANLEKEKELLRIFLRVSQMENTLLRRMNLPAFLMVPVQRVTKYPLLLNRLFKVTPYHHQDRESLKEAQQKIEFHLEHINQQIKLRTGGSLSKMR